MFQVVTCCLFDPKPPPESMLSYWQYDISEQTLIRENAFENVFCQMSAIFLRSQFDICMQDVYCIFQTFHYPTEFVRITKMCYVIYKVGIPE